MVPAFDDVPRAEGNRIERIAEVGSRRLELLREEDFLLPAERARAADLLEVRFQGSPLAAGIEILGRIARAAPVTRVAAVAPVTVCSVSSSFKWITLDSPV
jgi:hypothetical protein